MDDRKLAVIIASLVLIVMLSWATVAVAQNTIIPQRQCFHAGCMVWRDCDRSAGCPLHEPPVRVGCGGGCCGN